MLAMAGRGDAVRSALSMPNPTDAAFGRNRRQSYYLGFGEPVNLKPYFDEIQMHLNNSIS